MSGSAFGSFTISFSRSWRRANSLGEVVREDARSRGGSSWVRCCWEAAADCGGRGGGNLEGDGRLDIRFEVSAARTGEDKAGGCEIMMYAKIRCEVKKMDNAGEGRRLEYWSRRAHAVALNDSRVSIAARIVKGGDRVDEEEANNCRLVGSETDKRKRRKEV
jgi:hypothetical protein